MSASISHSNKLGKKGKSEKVQCPKCKGLFPKAKAKSHTNSCKGCAASGKFSDYSPIKEADDKHQPGEESKESSLAKVKKPTKVEESDSSY